MASEGVLATLRAVGRDRPRSQRGQHRSATRSRRLVGLSPSGIPTRGSREPRAASAVGPLGFEFLPAAEGGFEVSLERRGPGRDGCDLGGR
jgi:hypothetical protein